MTATLNWPFTGNAFPSGKTVGISAMIKVLALHALTIASRYPLVTMVVIARRDRKAWMGSDHLHHGASSAPVCESIMYLARHTCAYK